MSSSKNKSYHQTVQICKKCHFIYACEYRFECENPECSLEGKVCDTYKLIKVKK